MQRDVQAEAKALGDPSRHRLFQYIAEAPGRVTVAELTRFAGLNHNAVRQHLVVLKDAGLILEELERRNRPGRPRLLYRLRPEAAGRWNTPGAYTWLAGVLSAAVRRGHGPRQAGRREGRRRAAELARPADPLEALEEEMDRRGFRPARVAVGGRTEFVLRRCPFADVATDDPQTICQLHLGFVEGLAEGLGGLAVDGLAAQDARQAGCRLFLRHSTG